MKLEEVAKLQSLFTWIFYLFDMYSDEDTMNKMLQSLFTWIFYLFEKNKKGVKDYEIASILIHLDFLSI